MKFRIKKKFFSESFVVDCVFLNFSLEFSNKAKIEEN